MMKNTVTEMHRTSMVAREKQKSGCANSVLNSPQAIQASLFVVRAFVQLREMLSTHKELAQKLIELEERLEGHDEALRALVVATHELAEPLKERKGRRMGFRPAKQKK
jgi:hypothetical protein